jgi:hypothetical protein
VVRFVDRRFQLAVGNTGREVDKGGDGVGDRDAVDLAASRRLVVMPTMHPNAGAQPAIPASHDHVGVRSLDVLWLATPDTPEGRRAVVAEQRLRPAGKHCGHPPSEPSDVRPPDRVDPTHQGMEAAVRQPMLDRPRSHAKGEQLLPGHHPVLTICQTPDGPCPRLMS